MVALKAPQIRALLEHSARAKEGGKEVDVEAHSLDGTWCRDQASAQVPFTSQPETLSTSSDARMPEQPTPKLRPKLKLKEKLSTKSHMFHR